MSDNIEYWEVCNSFGEYILHKYRLLNFSTNFLRSCLQCHKIFRSMITEEAIFSGYIVSDDTTRTFKLRVSGDRVFNFW